MNNKQITELIKKGIYPENNLIPLDKSFINSNGEILNLITNGIESVAIITSVKGSIRSQHFHEHNAHFLFLVKGSISYHERNIDGSDIKENIYKAGDMFFTPPQKVHKVVSLEDTIMISLAPKSNEHSEHENDTIRMEF